MNNHDLSECRKLKYGTSNKESANSLREMSLADEKGFCFFASSDNNVLATNEVDIIFDSGCTNYILKNCELFATLDESFSGSVGSANNSESKIKGKGRANFFVCDYKDIRGCLAIASSNKNARQTSAS